MTIRISCPHCGVRSIGEWVHGEAFSVPDRITDADERDVDRAYMHDNPEGVVREAWFAYLPPVVQQAMRAATRSRPPSGYEDRLKRYFESID